MNSISGKTFLITGGASGLGLACVRSFLQKGAKIVILDINEENGQQICKEVDPSQTKAIFVKTDVTSEESVLNAISEAKKKFQRIDGAINCAGVGSAQRTANSRGPANFGLFKKIVEINLTGTFNVCRLVASEMISNQSADSEGERGVLINTASVAAYEGQIGQAAYSASKAGVAGMTIVMARDLAQYGIRVMTIAPGLFETPMTDPMPEEARVNITKSIAFPKRLGRAEEYAHLCVAIVENRYFNGETIRLDGGVRMAAL